jgi:hypothetical protein
LGGLCDRCGQEKRENIVELKRLARDRIAFRKWTEDPTLQANRDRQRRRRRRTI